MTPAESSSDTAAITSFTAIVMQMSAALTQLRPVNWDESEFQKQVEEYLNNADEIPYIELDELTMALVGICKISDAMQQKCGGSFG